MYFYEFFIVTVAKRQKNTESKSRFEFMRLCRFSAILSYCGATDRITARHENASSEMIHS
jgi:hypothetical protein